MTPRERGADTSGECAWRCVYVLVEAYGKCGARVYLESHDVGSREGSRGETPELGQLHSLLASEEKQCKTSLARRTHCPRSLIGTSNRFT